MRASTASDRCPDCETVWKHVFFAKAGEANFIGGGVTWGEALNALKMWPKKQRWTRIAFGYELVDLHVDWKTQQNKTIECEELHIVNAGLTDNDVSLLVLLVTQCFKGLKLLNLSGNYFQTSGCKQLRTELPQTIQVDCSFNSYRAEEGERKTDSRMQSVRPLHSKCEQIVRERLAGQRTLRLADMDNDGKVKEAKRILGPFIDRALGRNVDWSLVVFGSGKSGLYQGETSDVDFTVLLHNMEAMSVEAQKAYSAKMVKKIGYSLKGGKFGGNVEVLPWPRIPLIRIMNNIHLGEINIVVGHDMGLMNSTLLREYCLYDPSTSLVFYLGMRVKQWAKQHQLVDSSCLSSYSWILLLLFFLIQRLKLIPNLQSFANVPAAHLQGQQKMRFWGSSHEFNTHFMSAQHAFAIQSSALAPRPACSAVNCIMAEFFRFYSSQFDWSTQSIDIRDPATAWTTRHFNDNDNGNKFIALLDQFEGVTRNLAKGVSPAGFERIKDAFKQAASKARTD